MPFQRYWPLLYTIGADCSKLSVFTTMDAVLFTSAGVLPRQFYFYMVVPYIR